ncbi:hypothetical protein ACAX46_004145 [Providencia rettgeri]
MSLLLEATPNVKRVSTFLQVCALSSPAWILTCLYLSLDSVIFMALFLVLCVWVAQILNNDAQQK